MKISTLAVALAVVVNTAAARPLAPRLYETTTETGLPHLEENLRYATTHERMCLGERQLATAFPVLRHEALRGCRLDRARGDGTDVEFALHCPKGSDTSGKASWQLDANVIRGTLDVRLGGKNMTFYQRITGRAIGDCAPGD